MAADLDLLVIAELNPDVLVAAGDVDVRFGQIEQLVENATITLGSSGAITAAAAAAQGLSVGICAVVGDDRVGTWTTEMLADLGVDVTCVVRRAGRPTGMSVVITRPDGDRAILTFSGTMAEMSAADVPHEQLRAANHVHASSFFLQQGLQAGLPALFGTARAAGAKTSLDTGWAPKGEWANAKPVLDQVDYLLPNAHECVKLAATVGWRHDQLPGDRPGERDRDGRDSRRDGDRRPDGDGRPDDDGRRDGDARRGDWRDRRHEDGPRLDDEKVQKIIRGAAEALQRHGPAVAVKLGPAGGMIVGAGPAALVHGRSAQVVDTTGAGDSFNAGFIAGVLDGSSPTESLKRAVSSGTIAVTGWGGTGRLASRDEAVGAAAELTAERLPAR
ncbi:MAG: carbohydrate kinase family protein [Nocardiopsaceae bacterium]|nr:carbohydrate kinase family protein [Nocardiopsaceae bacterium]